MAPLFRRLLAVLLLAPALSAAPLTLTSARVPAPVTEGFQLGTAAAPDGQTIGVDSLSLLLNGRRWTPVMGEFHFSRYPAAEWREELRRLKAGGIDIVATYVFWIHHEESEGQWDWSGDKHLRAFVTAAAAEGLKVILRAGPWCHGEVRHGGLPDWLVARGPVRSDHPAYLASVRRFYAQIADQCRGLLWKHGRPIVGLQLENEYGGPAAHLLTLKSLARELGLDVPLYTRTGWPALKTPLPFGAILPLYGVYAEGFWDRETTAMPGRYWAGFHFSTLRTDVNIANEALGQRDVRDDPDVARYPYLTCEIGGGMMSSYHRRILVDPADIEATTLVKLGSGSVSPGYYMYHGGTNPAGRLTSLMEDQDTALTNWNDLPVKNYDFQAPLGQFGQIRPHYAALRRLHTFLHDFGERFAGLATTLPDLRPQGRDDLTTLRWSLRGDHERGFLFVNQHERGRTLPPKNDVQFRVDFPGRGSLTLPSAPVTVPSGACFFWPLNLDLGGGSILAWATAQPLALVRSGPDRAETWYFVATPGIPTEFVFTGARISTPRGPLPAETDSFTRVRGVVPGRTPALRVNASLQIVLLDATDSLAFTRDPHSGAVHFELSHPSAAIPVVFTPLCPAGPLRTIALGRSPQPVAAAPRDADFAAAARWSISLPADLDLQSDPLLRLHYTGDVARIYLDDQLILDDFANGLPLELGLRRHAAALVSGKLTVAILPLQKKAISGAQPPIYWPASTRPKFGARAALAELSAVELVLRP